MQLFYMHRRERIFLFSTMASEQKFFVVVTDFFKVLIGYPEVKVKRLYPWFKHYLADKFILSPN